MTHHFDITIYYPTGNIKERFTGKIDLSLFASVVEVGMEGPEDLISPESYAQFVKIATFLNEQHD